MGKGISRKLKDGVYRRDQGCCVYCGRFLTREDPDRTVDHVIPKSKGGPNRMWNLVVACKACNSEKDDADPAEEFLALVLKRKEWSELYVALGKAIGRAKRAGAISEAEALIKLQHAVWLTMHGLPQ